MKKILKATAVLLITAAVLSAAGCIGDYWTVEKGQVVTKADIMKTLTLNTGENFTLSLEENPTTGYSWELELSDGLTIIDDDYIGDPNPEGLAGVGGTHTWIIEAETAGSQKVEGVYKMPRQDAKIWDKRFILFVEVV